ncbi:MAG TPA: tetratricopeptide repeat protein [Longimicrobiales bacterium]
MRARNFFSELRRRHVLRVVGAYAVAAWIAVEVYTTVQPILLLDYEWTNSYIVLLAIVGFPVVFALAWIFDITPQGVQRTAPLGEVTPVDDAARAAVPARRQLSARATGFFGLGILVALVGFAAFASVGTERHVERGASIGSIAVLPFADLSSTRDQEYLSDGIAEELLNRLTQVPDLDVPARTSSFAFRGQNEDVREIGRRLGVEAVLEGSVRREGDHVRVQARLIDVSDGFQLWSETFEGGAEDVFALQDRISEAIVEALKVRIAPAPEAGERGTKNAFALEQYMLGLQRWHQRTDSDLRQARTHFQAAVDADTAFALAHAALAQAYAVLPMYGDYPVDSAVVRGLAAAARAIELDPSLGDAYAAMGQIAQNFEWDLPGAERFYRRALGYDPGDPTSHQWYAETLMLLGRYGEARSHLDKVLAANPTAPAAAYIDVYFRTLSGSPDAAAASSELILRHPGFGPGLVNHAFVLIAAGRTADAAAAIEHLAEFTPGRAALYRAVADGLRDDAARPAAVRAVLGAAALPGLERTGWLVALGENDRAMEAIDAAFRARGDAHLLLLLPHPLLRPLRGDPRFQSVVSEIGIVLRA